MNQQELIERVAEQQNIPKWQAQQIVFATLDGIVGALREGDMVAFRKFGIFERRHREPRTAHNPKTGEKVQVAARDVVVFRASKHLRQRINQDQ